MELSVQGRVCEGFGFDGFVWYLWSISIRGNTIPIIATKNACAIYLKKYLIPIIVDETDFGINWIQFISLQIQNICVNNPYNIVNIQYWILII